MWAAVPPCGSAGVNRTGREQAQYDATVVSLLAPAAMVNSTYVPSSRTTGNTLPTPVRRPSPSTGRGRARVCQAEPFQYSQAAGSASPASGTGAT